MSTPLKILLTDPHMKGGGQVRYVVNLAKTLGELGHRVIIGCKSGSVLVEKAAEADASCADGFTFKGGLRPSAWLHDLRLMRQLILNEEPDIVHVSGSQDHWVAAIANLQLGRPACLVRTRHNTYPVSDALPNRILNRRWTDYQIVVCDVVRRTLSRQRAFDEARMCSIHNGVDARAFLPRPSVRDAMRAKFGYTTSNIVCGVAARLVPAKGHVFLFRAVARLISEIPELRLLVLGHGDLEPELRALASELKINDITTFAGYREDMDRCVQAFDIGVQPSIDCDTSSFSLKEEMACEKPVVASDYGGLTEIVTDGAEGYVVPAGTDEPIADALRQLCRDEALRTRLGKAGRRRVLNEFTVQVFASRTVDAYRRALDLHRALRYARASELE